jgi:bifunctional UDP-N-acetylglucosamine pyrophosphorylase / glucosamine-1-phosphate N-acetyltransferase
MLSVIILAAGKGTRMRSPLPKVLHPVGGRSLLEHVLLEINKLNPAQIALVVGHQAEIVSPAAKKMMPAIHIIEQKEQLGTGHAVQTALQNMQIENHHVVVVYADHPFIKATTFEQLRHNTAHHAVSVLGFTPSDPARYGRLVGTHGKLEKIVEYKDATEAERAISLCNSGVMAFAPNQALALVNSLSNHNAAGEFYLTDTIAIARQKGLSAGYCEVQADEVIGINSQAERAQAEQLFQAQKRAELLDAGVMMISPETVYLSADTVIQAGSIIHPFVTIGEKVTIEEQVEIKSFCHLENCHIKAQAVLGPYARIRPGTIIEEQVHIGNFVEIKNSHIQSGAKANHLSYIGDADIGSNANIGAGTITCNYDGFLKHRTTIGEGAFIGSNSSLVAPVTIGSGAMIAAGSTITKNVPADAITHNHMPQTTREGLAKQFRVEKAAEKSAQKKGANHG